MIFSLQLGVEVGRAAPEMTRPTGLGVFGERRVEAQFVVSGDDNLVFVWELEIV